MKNIPNLLSISRILTSFILFWFKPFSLEFYVVYALCGVSDILDGYIARKTNSISKIGATLDSIGDFLLVVILLFIITPLIHIPIWVLWWVGTVAVIRMLSLSVAAFKFKAFVFLHTYANKLTGGLLFLLLFALSLKNPTIYFFLVCFVATVSAVEEFILLINMKELNRDAKSIFYNK